MNNLSPGLTGPVDVHITLPRTPHKSPVTEDSFKVSSTVICEDGSTRCGPAVRSKQHKTQSADGLLTLSDLDSPSILPITVPQQKCDAERIVNDMKVNFLEFYLVYFNLLKWYSCRNSNRSCITVLILIPMVVIVYNI